MVERIEWQIVAEQIEQRLDSTTGSKQALGEVILARLETYGEFYFRLFNQRAQDILFAQAQISGYSPALPPISASVLLGSLLLTSKKVGASGNNITVIVSSGTGETFNITGIPESVSIEHKEKVLRILSGEIVNPSSIPSIFALQEQASQYLQSITEQQRKLAEEDIATGWDRYRVARTSSDLEYDRDRIVSTFKNANLKSLSEYAEEETLAELDSSALADLEYTINNTIDGYIRKQREAFRNTFNLELTDGHTLERYTDIRSGESFDISKSNLIESITWGGSVRPDNGTYQFRGGVNGTPSRLGVKGVKSPGEYRLTLDDHRTYTLSELQTIVEETTAAGEAWLNS